MKKTKNGFSLVEVMIAASILGTLAYFGMTLMSNQTKSVAKTSFDSEIILITNEINGILSDPDKCLATLSTTATPTDINGKYFIQTHASAPGNGHGNANVKISSYSFTGTAPDGRLTIQFTNKNLIKGSTGPNTVPKRIEISFAGIPGAVTSCRAKSTGHSDIWIRNAGGFISDIFYANGNVAIGKANDRDVKLDVDGVMALKAFNVNDACTIKGTMSQDTSTGRGMYCDGTIWKFSGGNNAGTNIIIKGAVSGCRGRSTANCPAGYYVVSGGYEFQGSCGCPEEHRFATENYPTGNSWVATMECSRVVAYAICIQE